MAIRFHNAAIVAAVAAALLVVAVAVGWTAFSKQRQRQVVTNHQQLPVPQEETASPPLEQRPEPEPVERRPRYVPPLDVTPERPATTVVKVEPTPTPEQPPAVEAPPLKARPAFKRRDTATEEELRKQLLLTPEVSLDHVRNTSAQLQSMAKQLAANNMPFEGPAVLLAQRPDLQGLPLRMGIDCQVGKEPAENLQVMSRKMRVVLESAMPKDTRLPDPRPDADKLRAALLEDEKEWLRPEAVPCLLQLLQAENSPIRKVLVEMLGRIKDKRATQALAMRAMTDLNAEVREAAARGLLERPREEYEPLLLAGLRYPWAPVAVHAAETLAFVRDTEALPQLVKLLEQTDPVLPFTARQGTTPMIREVVRINHLSNCLLCHPPSLGRTDLVRGAVPTPGQALPAPATAAQYYENGSIFVHADTTYLKQDFSVMQPVVQHGEWPEHQRFDYLVRLRRATSIETATVAQQHLDKKITGSRDAVLFALRELSGRDLGVTARDWQPAVEPKQLAKTEFGKYEERVGADWKQFTVSAFSAEHGFGITDK